ncbi:hypothetical protein EDD11_004498 [Mortierella claussenii]|nr:hypothetical protein EDD11_004498 [Mortierella claussenii]
MLTTHLLSRKHLARVKSQAASLPDSTKRQRLELSLGSLPIPTEANDSVFKTKLGTTMDCATEDNPDGLESTSEGPPQYKSGQAPSGLPTQTAKQRRRKVERSRKKARARLCAVLGTGETHDTTQDRVATNSCLVASTGVEAEEKIEDVTSITSSDYTEDLTSNSAPLAASVSQDIHHAPGSDAIPSPHGVPSVSESTQVQVASPTGSIFRWHCSVCGSNWSRAKAWHGHLLSSQHLRRIERIMHKDVSPTVPYGRRDVLASSNPFGWGTCVGLVEEDEEEEEEQEVEQEYTASDLVSLVQEPDSEAADVPRNADQDDQGPDNDDMDLAD